MAIIDFRVRPLYKTFETKGFPESEGFFSIDHFFQAFGGTKDETITNRDVETLVADLRKHDVVKGVIPLRNLSPTITEESLELVEQYPDLFIGAPYLTFEDVPAALETIDKYIINGPGKVASTESMKIPYDDPSLDPIYQKLQDNNIPLVATISGFSPVINRDLVRQIDALLWKFPNLKFVAAHAMWPWINEAVALCFKHSNLYLTADFEGCHVIGSEIMKDAAQHIAKGQIIFASSYPFATISDAIARVKAWNLPKDIEEDVFYNNAAKILNL